MTDIKAPEFPESIADGEVATWHVEVGEAVKRDQVLVDIETDKVVLEVAAPADGAVTEILKQEGDTVVAEEVLAKFEEGAGGSGDSGSDAGSNDDAGDSAAAEDSGSAGTDDESGEEPIASPAARKLADENKIDLAAVEGTGKDGRITKEDVVKAVEGGSKKPAAEESKAPAAESKAPEKTESKTPESVPTSPEGRVERRVPMTRMRASIARRLTEVQQNSAMLTTFNEVDMTAVMELRNRYKDDFEKAHGGTRLGFMSFFVRASIEALKRFPAVNASIDDNDIVYHGYQDVGVAVSTDRGLVVPVLREADSLTLAEIEDKIREYGLKARDNKLSIEDLQGGTFTVSNGGVFGSLLSTPILNPPQTGILGMHKIQERPMAINGEVKIRPMMYLALSYDHRLIDGREAVQFLVTIKDFIEEPARILLDI